jgi:hypothetical protein
MVSDSAVLAAATTAVLKKIVNAAGLRPRHSFAK